jgi:predicted kinase
VLIGLPAAGKSTFYRRYFAATHRHISKDLWPNGRHKERRQQQALADAFAAGDSVVVDNTNPSAAERARIIMIAHASGAQVVGYFFDVTTREAVARNADRHGRDRVPNVAIFTTAKRLEPPSLSEGFDQLFRVTLTPERLLTVTEVTASSPSRSYEEM